MQKEERSKQGQTNNAKQHSTPKAVTFLKKNELHRVGFEPTILHTLDRAFYQLFTAHGCIHVVLWWGSATHLYGDVYALTSDPRPSWVGHCVVHQRHSHSWAGGAAWPDLHLHRVRRRWRQQHSPVPPFLHHRLSQWRETAQHTRTKSGEMWKKIVVSVLLCKAVRSYIGRLHS